MLSNRARVRCLLTAISAGDIELPFRQLHYIFRVGSIYFKHNTKHRWCSLASSGTADVRKARFCLGVQFIGLCQRGDDWYTICIHCLG